MKNIFLVCTFIFSIDSFSQPPLPNGGSIRHFENFSSRFIAARNVDVWLPDGYSVKKRYPVLYMHDGQMLFDSTHTWNHQEWQVDETISNLIKESKIRECIVVGIWNNSEYRHADYFPQKPLEYLPRQLREKLIKEEF